VLGALSAEDHRQLSAAGLDVTPVSLQQLIVRTTQHAAESAPATTGEPADIDEGALR